jgi:hypothetical protein
MQRGQPFVKPASGQDIDCIRPAFVVENIIWVLKVTVTGFFQGAPPIASTHSVTHSFAARHP